MREAIVAGAGVGGLAAALALAASGWRVAVLERARTIEDIGAGLQITPNAARVLARLGVLEALRGPALEPAAVRIRRLGDGRTIARLPLLDVEARYGAPWLLAHRADLVRALLGRVARSPDIHVMTDATLRGFAIGEDGRPRIALKRGGVTVELDADLLVGADGLRSLVRDRLAGEGADAPRPSGLAAWRALVDPARLPRELLARESQLWLGPGGHLVHYPLRGGTVVNVVAVVAGAGGENADEGWNAAGERGELAIRVAGWDASARGLIAAAGDWRRWPLFTRPLAPRLALERVALVGDAAHPMAPFLAQGAAQAIEDAAALAGALESAPTIEAGLAAYEAIRRPRVARIVAESARQGRIYHLAGPAAFARDLTMRLLGSRRLLTRNDWIYRA